MLSIGRYFVSNLGDRLFMGRTDLHQKNETVMRITVFICTPYSCHYQTDADQGKMVTNARFLIGTPRIW